MGPSLEIGPFGQSVGLFQMHCYASGSLKLIKWKKGSSGKGTNKFIMYIRNIEEELSCVVVSCSRGYSYKCIRDYVALL